MANGTFNFGFSNSSTLEGRINWSSVSNGPVANSSEVTMLVQIRKTNTTTTYRRVNIDTTIDNKAKNTTSASQYAFTQTWQTVVTHVETIVHGSDGKKSINLKIAGKLFGGASGSDYTITTKTQSVTLDTIPRYAAITTFTLGNATRDSFKVTWATDVNINRIRYSLNGGSTWTTASSATAKSGNFTVSGRAAGTKYNVIIEVRRADSSLLTESSSKSITTVAAAKANTPTLSSRTCIQAVVAWTATQTVDRARISINGGSSWVQTSPVFTARSSGSFTLAGLTPGTVYDVRVQVRDAVHGTYSATSAKLSVTPYRLSTYTIPAVNDGGNIVVNISRASSSITHDVTLAYYYNGAWKNWLTLNNQGTSATFTPTSGQWDSFYQDKYNEASNNLRVSVVNKWNNSTVQGTNTQQVNGALTIANAKPTIAIASYRDINNTIQAILEDDQKLLRTHSILEITTGLAEAKKYAELVEYTLIIGSRNFKKAASGSSQSGIVIEGSTVNGSPVSGRYACSIEVKDSRGYVTSLSFNVNLLDYVEPQIIEVSADRKSNYEQESYLNILARFMRVVPDDIDVNNMQFQYRIKENPDGEFGTWVSLIEKNTTINGAYQNVVADPAHNWIGDYPNKKTYTVELQWKDRFSSWKTRTVFLPEGIALMRFLQDKIILGVPLEGDPSIQVNSPMEFLDMGARATPGIIFRRGTEGYADFPMAVDMGYGELRFQKAYSDTYNSGLAIAYDGQVGIGGRPDSDYALKVLGATNILGAFWLNGGRWDNPEIVPNNTNVNNLTVPGLYGGGNATAASLLNAPDDKNFTLLVIPGYNGFIQLWNSSLFQNLYYRSFYHTSGTPNRWNPLTGWYRITTTAI